MEHHHPWRKAASEAHSRSKGNDVKLESETLHLIMLCAHLLQAGSPVTRILHLSDIHWDMNYTAGLSNDCGEAICCRPPNKPGALLCVHMYTAPLLCVHMYTAPLLCVHMYTAPLLCVHMYTAPLLCVHMYTAPLLCVHMYTAPLLCVHMYTAPLLCVHMYTAPLLCVHMYRHWVFCCRCLGLLQL